MSQLAEIQDTQSKLEESFSRRMAELEAKLQSGGQSKDTVARVAEEFRTFRELMFEMLRLLRKQIAECTRMIDTIETRHRRKALLFLGVAEKANESCSDVVLNAINNTLALKSMSAANITACHRIGSHSKDQNRPILVWFSGAVHRTSVWRAKAKLKGTPIIIKEFLTRSRQQVFSKARQHFGVRACWTQDGTIIVKDPDGSRTKVTTLEELNPLMAKYPRAMETSSVVRSGKAAASTSTSR